MFEIDKCGYGFQAVAVFLASKCHLYKIAIPAASMLVCNADSHGCTRS